jgi:hypothetical protein
VLHALLSLIALSAPLPEPLDLPRCSAERCAAVRLFIADGGDSDDAAFVKSQLEAANHYHAPAGLGFEVVEVNPLPSDVARVTTRSDRTSLGHARWRRGFVDVYIVSSLANVDAAGEIRGVHWRSGRARHRRWVILSRISPPHVLAHELGHYFGLAHSDVPASLMNTSATALPERTFQPDELARITRRAKRLFAEGVVSDPRSSP